MYVAYSDKKHDIVNVNDVFDLDEVFRCPNIYCTAKLSIRSATGKRAKHFARLPSTPHINNCDYENGDSRYSQPELQKRNSLEDIFLVATTPDTYSEESAHSNGTALNKSNILRINTPTKLLKFCRLNDLETEYLPGTIVNDIIVDERNLIKEGYFKGVQGLRIVVGKTVERYKRDCLHLVSTTASSRGKQVYLHADVRMDPEQLKNIRTHLKETYGSYEGHTVAVFGNWVVDKKYNISCEIQNRKHIMLKVE